MSYGTTITIAGVILIAGLTSSAEADHSSVLFEIQTWELNEESERVKNTAHAELKDINPVGRGNAADIECEGESNIDGILRCVVKHCNKIDPLTTIYLVTFKPPTVFTQVRPAKIRINRCEVSPVPIIAGFMERTLVAVLTQEDRRSIFGSATAVADAQLVKGVSAKSYSAGLSVIIEQPFGVFRAGKLRRFVQDASMNALEINDNTTAIAYQRLMTAHANVMLKYSAVQITIEGFFLRTSGELPTLNTNIITTKNVWKRLADQGNFAPWADLLPTYTSVLSEIHEATSQGQLANQEFKRLETLAVSIQPDMI